MPTYGPSGAPNSSTYYYNALVTATMGEYRPTFKDNITRKSSFFGKIKFEKKPGALHLTEKLMYELAPTDTYEGFDELSLQPTDGLTEAQYDWSQTATPIAASNKEIKMNKTRMIDLVKFKIKQAEMSLQEFWPKAFLRGSIQSGGNDIREPYTSSANGSQFVLPLGKLVMYDPTTSVTIGGINQSTKTWWRNQTKTSSATTREGLIDELIEFRNDLSKGAGGKTDWWVTDQYTWQLIHKAYRAYFNNNAPTFGDLPFENINFFGTPIVWDEYVPDVAANSGAGSTDTKNGKGTLYGLNTEFIRFVSEEDTDFVPSGDFERPINQDAQFKHLLWMGGVSISNRFKQGVMGNIARSLS